MTSLSTKELDRIRSDIGDTLPDTCTIMSPTYTQDNFGGFTQVFGTASANVPCRLDVIKPREQVIDGKNTHFTQFMVSLPWDTTISPNYRVVIGSDTFNVVGISPAKSWNVVKRAVVEAVS